MFIVHLIFYICKGAHNEIIYQIPIMFKIVENEAFYEKTVIELASLYFQGIVTGLKQEHFQLLMLTEQSLLRL